jgi:hypothetical protein
VTVQIRDSDGTVRLSGDLLASGGATGDVLTRQADGTYAPDAVPAPTLPHTQEFLANTPGQAIANNDFLALDWNLALTPGDVLLNLTVPALPTIVTTGNYAFNVQVFSSTTFTAGGYFQAQLELDLAGADWATIVTSPLATAAANPVAPIPVTMYLLAGMQVKLSVSNFDGVKSIDFTHNTLVQRVG